MNKSLEKLKKIQELCMFHELKISTAESCTGGYISKLITDISGSSKFYVGSIIAYSNNVKYDLLNVPIDVVQKYGAVSREVSKLMAEGLFNSVNCNIAIATTGIMEIDESNKSKRPQVFITIKSEDSYSASHFDLHGNRQENRQNTVNHTFDCLYDFIHKNYLVS